MSSGKKRGLPGRRRMRHDQHFVEELTTRVGVEPVGRMIQLQVVAPNPEQPRTAMGDLSELIHSVEERGVLEPILIRGLAEDEAAPRGVEYIIISGERRFHAARAVGLEEIPAIVMEVDSSEALEIALIENLQRKDLTPFEEADGCRALGDVHGYTHADIAKAVGKSRTSVTESLGLLKLANEVRSAAEALGIDSKSILLEVAKVVGGSDAQIALLERVANEGLRRNDLREEAATGGPPGARAQARTPGASAPTFTFRDPEKTFSVSLRFRKETVDREDLISALQRILDELKSEGSE